MFARNVAHEYFAVRWLLSRIASTLTPRLCALINALPIPAEVNEYACTSISDRAALISFIILSVHVPPVVNHRSMAALLSWPAPAAATGRANNMRAKSQKYCFFIYCS